MGVVRLSYNKLRSEMFNDKSLKTLIFFLGSWTGLDSF